MNVLVIVGTRPEAIKMAPLIKLLKSTTNINPSVCVTAQHREMLAPILSLFHIRPDFDLDVMTPDQSLSAITSAILRGMGQVIEQFIPDLILVQGDTNTAFAASLASYYHRIPVGHIEAGLRTGSIYAPWPEEGNRKMIGAIASMHFAPTEQARRNLLAENIPAHAIHVTGNTVIDALLDISTRIENEPTLAESMRNRFPFLRESSKLILITAHRRENFGEGLRKICAAIRQLSSMFPETDFVYPVHPNPNVVEPVQRYLADIVNIHLIPPQDYLPFIWLMKHASLLLTDSGGIQEEALSLGKPVLLMRESTERPEGVLQGGVALVGTNEACIIREVAKIILEIQDCAPSTWAANPFGDGNAAARIVNIICNSFSKG